MKTIVALGSGDTATVTTSAIDTKALTGKIGVGVVAAFTAGTTPAATYKITHCATSGGTYTDAVTLAADGSDLIDSRNLHRYIKVVATITGEPTATVIAAAVSGEVNEV